MTPIDDYLKDVPLTKKNELERIRTIVKSLVPDGEEVISYGMPTIKYKGKYLIYFGAFKDHLSVFPTGDPTLEDIEGYAAFKTSKGTLQFTEEKPIPDKLVKALVLARIESIDSGRS